MQHLEFSVAVRPLKWSLGVKGLMRAEEARPASDSCLQILSYPRSRLRCETVTDDP